MPGQKRGAICEIRLYNESAMKVPKLENTEQIASVENELAVLAAEIATVRKLKKRQI